MLGSSEILFQPFCKGTTSSNRFQQEPITSKKTRKFGLFWINRGKLGVQRNWKRNFPWNHSADPWPFLFDFRADLKKNEPEESPGYGKTSIRHTKQTKKKRNRRSLARHERRTNTNKKKPKKNKTKEIGWRLVDQSVGTERLALDLCLEPVDETNSFKKIQMLPFT